MECRGFQEKSFGPQDRFLDEILFFPTLSLLAEGEQYKAGVLQLQFAKQHVGSQPALL